MSDGDKISLMTPAEAVFTRGVSTGRPYLDRATEELLIGLMQLAFHPSEDEWYDLWASPPSKSEITDRLAAYEDRMGWRHAFQLQFQYDKSTNAQPISMIMPDGASDRKNSFNAAILSRTYDGLSIPYAMLALVAFHYTCTTLRAGDGGYTKGGISAAALRVRPVFDDAWQNIWANVMPDLHPFIGRFPWEDFDPAPLPSSSLDIMSYFLVSRRICLGKLSAGTCSISHKKEDIVSTIRTADSKDFSLDENVWVHPLCPRKRVLRKGAASPEAYHIRAASVPNVTSWREWVGYTQPRGTAGGEGFEPSRVVDEWRRRRGPEIGIGSLRLLAYGMRYEKADPVGWVETLGHVFMTAPDRTDDLFAETEILWNAANSAYAALNKALRIAIPKPNPDQLWLDTDEELQKTASDLASAFRDGAARTGKIIEQLRDDAVKTIKITAYRQFDNQTAGTILRHPEAVRIGHRMLSRSLAKIGA